MKQSMHDRSLLEFPSQHHIITTAVVAEVTADGVAMVLLAGDSKAREAASLVTFASAVEAADALIDQTVLVAHDASTQPIILGVVRRHLLDEADGVRLKDLKTTLPPGDDVKVQIDKKRVSLEASQEIRLTCGKSCLILRRDGTVIVRGVRVVSRASQSNKIKGASVSIN